MSEKPKNAPKTPEMLSEDQLDAVSAAGDDGQLTNLDLQGALQDQQDQLTALSTTSKSLHDAATSIIKKIG